MSTIYLAARFSRRFECQGYRAELQRIGHIVTSRWIDNSSDDEADSLKCARIDIQDLDAADTVIAFGDEPRSTAAVADITSNSDTASHKASESFWSAIVTKCSIICQR
jgi:hypothetical protein